MKTNIHPKWFNNCKVTCACGNTFKVGNTVPSLRLDVCSACHPFYTGQMKFVDAAGRVDAFKAKQTKTSSNTVLSKTKKRALKREKRIEKELERPSTLAELRKSAKKK